MRMNDLTGLEVTNCRRRIDFRTGYSAPRDLVPGVCTLLIITKGRGMVGLRQADIHAGKGDVFFWVWNAFRELRPLPASPFSYYIINFRCLSAEPETDSPAGLLPTKFRPTALEPVLRLVRAVWRAFQGSNRLDCAVNGLSLLRLLAESGKVGVEPRLKPVQDLDPRIRKVLTYISDHIKEPLKTHRLAQSVGMHPSHFIRLFRKMTAMLPRQYVLERKIAKAKDYMTLYDDPPSSASLELGFHDYAHFFRTFRRIAGTTPRAYIRKHRLIAP